MFGRITNLLTGFGGCKNLVKPFNLISKVVVLFRVVAIGGWGADGI